MCRRLREQARSHIRPYFHGGTRLNVGAGLLAKGGVTVNQDTGLKTPDQRVPKTFFAKLVAAAAGFWRMVASCLPIISNNPSSACSVT